MTDMAASQPAKGVTARVSAWIARRQRQFSDHLHADEDALAHERGWTITKTTGRFGFGGRVYRDPRFDKLAGAARRDQPFESEMWQQGLPNAQEGKPIMAGSDTADGSLMPSHRSAGWAKSLAEAVRAKPSPGGERSERGVPGEGSSPKPLTRHDDPHHPPAGEGQHNNHRTQRPLNGTKIGGTTDAD
jgi:hypothetical protein